MKSSVVVALVVVVVIAQLAHHVANGQLTFSKSWSSGKKRAVAASPMATGQLVSLNSMTKLTSRLEQMLKEEDHCFQRCHANFYAGILELPDTVSGEYE
ncbi:hypothetical protein HDE_01269 [Halotydeus destructor]|nr:hypothetical protein HDE_01269 [Halotydeus destructor]